ncbi:Bax inhibitor-1/YccA family membrane protein [Actinomyces wuliandei]|uniref:Bax inhibitor-1/YccA family membrane protein n=1 Tax=Actinomyces wuliandei TaxID=2057743 RepID=UPI000FDC2D9A|nr:Bax inhibitor-1/YccA family protein [Actinomyces wuliandei]
MSNPFFSQSRAFAPGGGVREAEPVGTTPGGYPTMPGYQPGHTGPGQVGYAAQQQSYGAGQGYGQTWGQVPGQAWGQHSHDGQAGSYGQVSPEQVAGMEARYQAPAATSTDMRRMTYDDVIIRTAGLFAVIVVVGAVSWNLVTTPATTGLGTMLMLVGLVGGLVLGLVNSFKRVPSPALIMAYAVCEGLLLGGFSGIMEHRYEGIVAQAVLATAATFVVVLCAYRFAGFRVQGRVRRVLLVAVGGYLLFSLVNLGLVLTGVTSGQWGLRSIEVMGIPLGVVIGLAAVVMAAFCLAVDFESIQQGVDNRLPQRYAWAGAFGLVVTIVWMYIEFLRLLSYFRD